MQQSFQSSIKSVTSSTSSIQMSNSIQEKNGSQFQDSDNEDYKDNEVSGPRENFRVSIRIRPKLPRELNSPNVSNHEENQILLSENFAYLDESHQPSNLYPVYRFTFDNVLGENTSQETTYISCARDSVLSFLQGYNATILAYGCTSTGKTFTMEGGKNVDDRGIIPRATEEIFNYIQTKGNSKTKFLVRASYLQIYNETISDLLKPERSNLNIREDKKKGIYVEGLSEWVVRSPSEVYGLLERGSQARSSAATLLNMLSSRSHAVFIIICEQSETTIVTEDGREMDIDTYKRIVQTQNPQLKGEARQKFRIGKLNLVDLAGSENVKFSGAKGARLRETQSILTSLSALGQVIRALTDPQPKGSTKHIPYRNSKLTRLLTDSLGGNCKTHLISTISPCLEIMHETLSTLRFANRAKNIQNNAQINEDLDHRALLRKYEKELKRLRQELEKRSSDSPGIVSNKYLEELQEYARRAEEDKMAAVAALERRSREFVAEKQAKRELEKKIALMQSQMLIGGEKIEETPAFRQLLKKEYERVHRVYNDKLSELERERQSIEEDKAQVDRYKHLLLKQRDIMIALTGRLNERDEIILQLQEELDAYDAHQRMLEESLDQKSNSLMEVQKELKNLQEEKGLLNPVSNQEQILQQQLDERDWFIDRLKKQIETLKQTQNQQSEIVVSTTDLESIQLREMNVKLQAELKESQEEIEQLKLNFQLLNGKSNDTSSSTNIDSIQKQLEIWKKVSLKKDEEKQALKTILEKKVLPALSDIYKNITQLQKNATEEQEMLAKETAIKLIVPLHKLVAASAHALNLSDSPQT